MKKIVLLATLLMAGFSATCFAETVYFSNLPPVVTSEVLYDICTRYGTISSARVVMDRETGRSKGYGFVEVPDTKTVDLIIKELNGARIGDKAISVSRPVNNRSRR